MNTYFIFLLLSFTTLAFHGTATTHQQQQEGSLSFSKEANHGGGGKGRVIGVEGGPESVVWVVQLSDLHFSVHHPDRALDFKRLVGPALSMINPSLVLITGDLTDGKSKDLLTMKQNEEEWVEYEKVMGDVITRSRLDKSIFYDLRGNHDNFGVPNVGGSLDFFSKYSINGKLGRRGNVNIITIETAEWKHLFVGFDSTMSVGLRGPTNLFGHPTDELLTEIDSELSRCNFTKPVTKISFGHFPLSFSASSFSGRSLKDIFLKHSLSAYLCGHLHTRFGKNLKRHHHLSHHVISSEKFFQLNMNQMPFESAKNCSFGAPPVEDFWEWEMGDWRKSRAMRIVAIDRGHVSYVDLNFKSGAKKTIILPTFPLDSRFMSSSSSRLKYECQYMVPRSYETIRALVFSVSPILSVTARIYDSRPGHLDMVMEALMRKNSDKSSRGDLYLAPWNYGAFEDPSPDRFWLQIEATDVMGRSTMTELRPFSVNGRSAKYSWTWKEFFVMGVQWATLYYPILWSALYFLFFILLVPKALLVFSKQYTYKNFVTKKGIIDGIVWVLQELCKIVMVWYGILGYLFYLILFPWCFGQVFTDGGNIGYMTYMGWVVKTFDSKDTHEYIGSPDVMVVVLPHLVFMVLPATLLCGALAAERSVHKERVLSLSGKKEDDYSRKNDRSLSHDYGGSRRAKLCLGVRWIRKILLVVCLALCWKHFMNCRVLIKAYEMNPLIHFPVYSFFVPLLLAYAAYKTARP
ncbi:hypothetical protein LWI28_025232 [Acer negundo]|uniref:Calcineurin-like phosphoesterase domain-containing protein n=1 Tax=Acer negundo TaxID=4023 RepID=A0AAD5IAP8_ACENE|nr:hypothetical protein LWI28_025232 [Acer negundo]